MQHPQVILVSGAPGAGKTTLGRALAARLGYASLTVDDLAVAVRSVTSPETHPAFHPVGRRGHVAYFTDSTTDELISDSVALQDVMWPVIELVIRMRLLKRSPVVIDWWLIPIEAVGAIEAETKADVQSLWLHIDADALWAREQALTDFTAASSDPERMLANFMSRSLWRNNLVASSAASLGLRLVDQPGSTPVDTLVDRAIDLLDVVS